LLSISHIVGAAINIEDSLVTAMDGVFGTHTALFE